MDALTCVELGKEMVKGFQAGLAGLSEKCKIGGTDEHTHDDDRRDRAGQRAYEAPEGEWGAEGQMCRLLLQRAKNGVG